MQLVYTLTFACLILYSIFPILLILYAETSLQKRTLHLTTQLNPHPQTKPKNLTVLTPKTPQSQAPKTILIINLTNRKTSNKNEEYLLRPQRMQ